jgi:hypothetical protein
MCELEFNEAISKEIHDADDGFSCKAFADYLMGHAYRKHLLAVEEARTRPIQREAAREYRKVRYEKRLNAVLLIASMIGIAVATWFLTSVGTN